MSKKQQHIPRGDPCEKCGLPPTEHRARKNALREKFFAGIDGEGQGRFPHRYVLLGTSNEDKSRTWTLENPEGLSTLACLNFIIDLPHEAQLFGYSLGYDWTMVLKDVGDRALYELFRPEDRPGKFGPRAVRWEGFELNLQGTKFTIKRGKRKRVVWDVWKFYQSKFVSALKDWKVGEKELHDRMQLMKDKRNVFDRESIDDVRAYCLEECMCMAQLARKLVDAHGNVGLELTSFYGAGSTGGALLKKMGILKKNMPVEDRMKEAVAAAFFGGRFENSVIGLSKEKVFNYDISSAYPYQQTFLPCLEHARWEHVTRRGALTRLSHAIVRYRLRESRVETWGPFPFRTQDGNICYPIESGGGWVYLEEYLAAESMYPNVEFVEAWGFKHNCEEFPFETLPEYYRERVRIGKEGPGMVLKLGMNSGYGKLAQSIGNAPFNNWVWAGMITSGCRAQILEMQSRLSDWSNMLMVATDGVFTREEITPPVPLNTGTMETGKPLGGWEKKEITKGLFVARPGIYFPLNPTAEEIKDVRGRGVGKGVVLENSKLIVEGWEKYGLSRSVKIANVDRFCGAKTSLSKSAGGFNRASAKDGSAPGYGEWISRSVDMSFDPLPKREGVNPDGVTLTIRRMPSDVTSMPYKKSADSIEARAMAALEQELSEQPDADYADYGDSLDAYAGT